ncbi:hypothetical protein D3C76_1118300 [compost metagenome]
MAAGAVCPRPIPAVRSRPVRAIAGGGRGRSTARSVGRLWSVHRGGRPAGAVPAGAAGVRLAAGRTIAGQHGQVPVPQGLPMVREPGTDRRGAGVRVQGGAAGSGRQPHGTLHPGSAAARQWDRPAAGGAARAALVDTGRHATSDPGQCLDPAAQRQARRGTAFRRCARPFPAPARCTPAVRAGRPMEGPGGQAGFPPWRCRAGAAAGGRGHR